MLLRRNGHKSAVAKRLEKLNDDELVIMHVRFEQSKTPHVVAQLYSEAENG
jgi:hypothetical protein